MLNGPGSHHRIGVGGYQAPARIEIAASLWSETHPLHLNRSEACCHLDALVTPSLMQNDTCSAPSATSAPQCATTPTEVAEEVASVPSWLPLRPTAVWPQSGGHIVEVLVIDQSSAAFDETWRTRCDSALADRGLPYPIPSAPCGLLSLTFAALLARRARRVTTRREIVVLMGELADPTVAVPVMIDVAAAVAKHRARYVARHPTEFPSPDDERLHLSNLLAVDDVSFVLRSMAEEGAGSRVLTLAGTAFLRNVQVGPFGFWADADFVREHERRCVAEEVPFRTVGPMFVEELAVAGRCGGDREAAESSDSDELFTPRFTALSDWRPDTVGSRADSSGSGSASGSGITSSGSGSGSGTGDPSLPTAVIVDLWGHYCVVLPVYVRECDAVAAEPVLLVCNTLATECEGVPTQFAALYERCFTVTS